MLRARPVRTFRPWSAAWFRRSPWLIPLLPHHANGDVADAERNAERDEGVVLDQLRHLLERCLTVFEDGVLRVDRAFLEMPGFFAAGVDEVADALLERIAPRLV